MNPFENDSNGTSCSYNAPRKTPIQSGDLQTQIKMSMDRQLQSTTRCLSSLHEAQTVGSAAAEELVEQGEKLNRAEANVDKILQDTKQSQRHLNSIKSVFGGIKNWWSGSDKTTPTPVETRVRTNKTLDEALAGSRDARDSHPIINKKVDAIGFFDDDIKDFKDYDPDAGFTTGSSQAIKGTSPANRALQTSTTTTTQRPTNRSEFWNEYDKGMETNLGQMSNGLENLKMLAAGMKNEIETQNSQLDRITDKVDRSDTKVRNQNMQMKRILGK